MLLAALESPGFLVTTGARAALKGAASAAAPATDLEQGIAQRYAVSSAWQRFAVVPKGSRTVQFYETIAPFALQASWNLPARGRFADMVFGHETHTMVLYVAEVDAANALRLFCVKGSRTHELGLPADGRVSCCTVVLNPGLAGLCISSPGSATVYTVEWGSAHVQSQPCVVGGDSRSCLSLQCGRLVGAQAGPVNGQFLVRVSQKKAPLVLQASTWAQCKCLCAWACRSTGVLQWLFRMTTRKGSVKHYVLVYDDGVGTVALRVPDWCKVMTFSTTIQCVPDASLDTALVCLPFGQKIWPQLGVATLLSMGHIAIFTVFRELVVRGRWSSVRRAVTSRFVSVRAVCPLTGWSLLHCAIATGGGAGLVKWLLCQGADVNAEVADTKETPCALAVRASAPLEVLQALVCSGADVNMGQPLRYLLARPGSDASAVHKALVLLSSPNADVHGLPVRQAGGNIGVAMVIMHQVRACIL
jgi:hypothetical protein